MASDGRNCFVFLLIVFLVLIGFGIFYRKEIQEIFDDSPKIIRRTETPVNAFLIKKYYKPNTFYNKMTIHAANDLNETELYRINWSHSINMTLTRIEDEFVVSRAQRIDQSSYSFEIFGQSRTNGKIVHQGISQANFDIEYTNQNHETSKLVLRNYKQDMILFRRFQWSVQWIDQTLRVVGKSKRRLIMELMNPNKGAYLQEKSEIDFDPVFGSTPYPYVYNLYVLKYLPDEFYLTTLIISD